MAAPPSEPPRPQSPYPVVCPKCQQHTGQPYDVKMFGVRVPVTVYLECETCKHKWTTDGPAPLKRRREPRR